MLDLGLTKMALIGVVALVVLGPERLPRVARTAGALFGRAQRYINDVKAEVTREIELDALRQMKTEFESAARNVENSIHDNLRKHETELNEAFRGGTSTSPSIAGGATGEDSAGDGTASPWRTTAPPTVKRVSWRTKRSAAPVWYKRTVGRRAHVQSGAARVARHTPASLRKQRRFL
ncbi:Sec-independent protein translocase protein TatB [Trinickia dinghuensis]|uniref:Sec-independent protein translocase protein TatB n=1 Tax=Trinickia dinghuensis TaxID=2291023 RepID=A0A3D8JRZ3_9BURK|nr:Sec-independent protein translocase protein TatB [Trinickia dinghuensis]RDU95505.1 Sec-independent protein translocase subunit TatB [Trinickia dinghuensis]